MTQFVTIDRAKRLKEQPETGHNRWHPDISPIVEVEQHENIVIETRDASDGQVTSETTASDFEAMDQNVSHPLTGPVYVKGAEPGDLLEVEYVEVFPQPYGWTRFRPGAGFLRDIFDQPYVAPLGHRARLRDIRPDSWSPHPGRVFYGNGRGCSFA